MDNSFYQVEKQINCWNLSTTSEQTVKYVERILRSMEASALSTICDSRFQIAAPPEGMIWAYFPIYRRRWIVRAAPLLDRSQS